MRVEPDGPSPGRFMIVGERPGFEEQQAGQSFVGKAGRELWVGLARFCGLERTDCYVTNVVKEGAAGNRKPTLVEIAAALPELLGELAQVRPEIVVAVGATGAGVFLSRPLADLHGIPHCVTIAGQCMTVHPTYHSAAGLHTKGYLAAFAYDLDRLGGLLRGDIPCWQPSSQPMGWSWLTGRPDLLLGSSGRTYGLDTEGWADAPWGLSFSPDGEHGYVIRADDQTALAWFHRWARGRTAVLHHSLHDLPVLRAMGVELGAFHDTQVLAYHDMIRTGGGVLEAESQNLGTLAYRELGMVLGELADLPGVDLKSRQIPYSDEVMEYAATDAIATRRLFDVYRRRGLLRYRPYQIDLGQIPLVDEMMATGMPFDLDGALSYYTDVQQALVGTRTSLTRRAARLGNPDFNPGSHPQVRALVQQMGLRIYKRTRGGLVSTSEKALAAHQGHPFVARVQRYREQQKLLGTYLIPLIKELTT